MSKGKKDGQAARFVRATRDKVQSNPCQDTECRLYSSEEQCRKCLEAATEGMRQDLEKACVHIDGLTAQLEHRKTSIVALGQQCERLEQQLEEHRLHKAGIKIEYRQKCQQLAAAQEEDEKQLVQAKQDMKVLKNVHSAAKKLAACFPDEIPGGQEQVSFDIPAYIVEQLQKALAQKGGHND